MDLFSTAVSFLVYVDLFLLVVTGVIVWNCFLTVVAFLMVIDFLPFNFFSRLYDSFLVVTTFLIVADIYVLGMSPLIAMNVSLFVPTSLLVVDVFKCYDFLIFGKLSLLLWLFKVLSICFCFLWHSQSRWIPFNCCDFCNYCGSFFNCYVFQLLWIFFKLLWIFFNCCRSFYFRCHDCCGPA